MLGMWYLLVGLQPPSQRLHEFTKLVYHPRKLTVNTSSVVVEMTKVSVMHHRNLLPFCLCLTVAACTPPSHVESSAATASSPTPALETSSSRTPSAHASSPSSATVTSPSVPSGIPASSASSRPASSEPLASSSAVSASIVKPPPVVEPKLIDKNGELLPQTKDEPSVDSPLYKHHVELLFEAIKQDKPDLARDFFFPLVAYERVKGIAKPARDWKHRLWGHFERDVHEYHRKLGPEPEKANLERIDFLGRHTKWMKPGSEGNRIGYYRITHTRIVGTRSDGRSLHLELTAMISWRGEWYVVHLHGFK